MFPLHSEMPYIKEDGKRSTLGEMLDQESSDISDLKSRMTTAEGDIDTLEDKMTTAEGDIDTLEGKVSDLSDAISDAYDETATYAVGDYFIYEDTIYEVITACTGITPPNAEYYTAHNVTDLITTLKGSLTEVQDIFESNAGAHNSIYRGKSLGTSVTTAQYSAISAGTFDDMYIGDYWTINSVVYRIAAFDYWYRTGDTQCTTHHVVLVPDSNLDTQKMNSTATAEGGYIGSQLYTTNLATAKSTIETAFGSAHILSHRALFSNAISSNCASAQTWADSTINLMNETMVFGFEVNSSKNIGAINYNVGLDRTQLPLFQHDASKITNRTNWWLRSIVSSAHFAMVSYVGSTTFNGASDSLGVRPAFAIIGS